MPSAYPTTTDLTTHLETLGATAPSTTLMQVHLDAAVELLERTTGFSPFLASGTPSARVFDPPSLPYGGAGYLLDIVGAVSVTSVQVNWDGTTGDTLALNTGYKLVAVQSGPYQSIEILGAFAADPQSVRVVADWGYSSDVPSDVWLAVLRCAGNQVAQSSGALSKIKQGPVEFEYQAGSGAADAWADELRSVARRYTKIYL